MWFLGFKSCDTRCTDLYRAQAQRPTWFTAWVDGKKRSNFTLAEGNWLDVEQRPPASGLGL